MDLKIQPIWDSKTVNFHSISFLGTEPLIKDEPVDTSDSLVPGPDVVAGIKEEEGEFHLKERQAGSKRGKTSMKSIVWWYLQTSSYSGSSMYEII